MFSTKISNIESQIQALTEQLNSYRTLETELEQAMSAIARIKSVASELAVVDEVEAFLGVSKSEKPKVEEYEAMLVNRDLRIERLEEQFTSVAKERDEKNIEITDLRKAIAQLEAKLEEVEFFEEVFEIEEKEIQATTTKISEEEARASIFPERLQLSLPCIEVEAQKAVQITQPEQLPQLNQLSLPTIVADSVVELPDGTVGKVLDLKNGIATVRSVSGTNNFVLDGLCFVAHPEPAKNQGSATKPQPANKTSYSEIQEKAQDMYSFRTWGMMKGVIQEYDAATKCSIVKEMCNFATTKTREKLLQNLPNLIAKYCTDRSDRTDLEWLPQTVARRVEELLSQAAVA